MLLINPKSTLRYLSLSLWFIQSGDRLTSPPINQGVARDARDALATPVSTVVSEAAFSTGGRVVNQFCSSLSPKFVECLICMQDCLCATPLPFEVKEDMTQIQDLELG